LIVPVVGSGKPDFMLGRSSELISPLPVLAGCHRRCYYSASVKEALKDFLWQR
jgi:hypothetical protein